MPNDPSRAWKSSLRDLIASVPMFDGGNIFISKYINAYRSVQTTHQEEADMILLIGKLHGRMYKALHDRHFISLTELMDWLPDYAGHLPVLCKTEESHHRTTRKYSKLCSKSPKLVL